jgi:tRNA(fMet)-specific endonuclease VapC
MRVMLDTNAYSAFKKGAVEIVELLAKADEILLPTPVLGELRSGFRSGNREAENIRDLESFLGSPRVRIHPLGEETAIFYAELHSSLRSEGKPIPTNDLWIAASALETGSILISRDTHFDAVAGLLRR